MQTSELLSHFESLGDNCEFGIVQRHYALEPLGLLRWSGANHADVLIRALAERFADFGQPNYLDLGQLPGWSDYTAFDRKFGFYFHTEVPIVRPELGSTDEPAKPPTIHRRMQFLRDKLLQDLTHHEKIFVYRQKTALGDTDLERLFTALRAYGPNILLYAQENQDPALHGTISIRKPGLVVGFINRLSNENPPQVDIDAWVRICAATYAYVQSADITSEIRSCTVKHHRDMRTEMLLPMHLNDVVHQTVKTYSSRDAQERFDAWWAFAERNALHETEYLLPTALVPTQVREFSYEADATVAKDDQQMRHELSQLGHWAYQMEFKGKSISTVGRREDREWRFHRYRGSLLVRAIGALLDRGFTSMRVLDVGCHCGPFSLEFAYSGAAQVVGVDLREQNIVQANWLASTYGINNVVFLVENARHIDRYRGFDIAFCAGLLYHLTFPIEFLKSLHDCCTDFAIIDSAAHKDPLSTFHLTLNKNTEYSAEGETSYELHPTYRAIIDCLISVGFEEVIEIVGTQGADIWGYGEGITRSFIAFKAGSKSRKIIKKNLGIADV